jgi:hypothetical protein
LPSIFWSARLSASRRRSRCRIIQTATFRRNRPTGPGPSGARCRSKPRPATEPLIPAARPSAAPACAIRVPAPSGGAQANAGPTLRRSRSCAPWWGVARAEWYSFSERRRDEVSMIQLGMKLAVAAIALSAAGSTAHKLSVPGSTDQSVVRRKLRLKGLEPLFLNVG